MIMVKSITRIIGLILITALWSTVSAQKSAASLYNTGLEKAKAKKYVEALSLMEQAIAAADPESETDAKVIGLAKKNASRAAYAIGFNHRKAKEYAKAVEMFDKGIEYNPAYYSNYKGKAQALESQGDATAAVTMYVKAGDVATETGKADKAEPLYSKAAAFVGKAVLDDQHDEGIALATAFMEAGQESADVDYYYGRALGAKGQHTEALESVSKALAAGESEEASKYYMFKAECHVALGQKSEAIAAYSKVTDSKYAERAKYEIGQLGG